MTRKIKKKRPLKDKILIGVSVSLMIIAILAVAIVFLWNVKLFQGKNGNIVNNNDVLEKTGITGENGEPIDAEQINFLVCGLDESEQMTDIIMLACVDLGNNTVNVLQIPRDTYIESGAGSTNKINSAYGSGDKSLTPINRLINVINQQYDLKVDHYATVTIESFRNIVDAIGGVPIDMPYQIGNNEYGIIPKGYQVLDGEHAEWLVRHRHTYVDQDIGRIKIQRLFLASALQQVKEIGIKEVTKLVPAIAGEITTDLAVSEVKDYASLALNINMENISMFIVPGEGVTYNGQSVWSMHYYETADMLNEYFRPYTEDVPADELGITELAHTGEYYENTEDDFEGLLNGETPGKQNSDDTVPAYTHIVTQPTTKTTTEVTTTEKVTTAVTTTETTPYTTTTTVDTEISETTTQETSETTTRRRGIQAITGTTEEETTDD